MRLFLAVSALSLMVGCHGTVQFVDGTGLAPAPGPETAACNDLTQEGEIVGLVASPDEPPVASGGVIADGTYILTSSRLHTRATQPGSTLVVFGRITMAVTGGTAQLVVTKVNGQVKRSTISRANTGTSTSSSTTCASPGPVKREATTVSYSANASGFQFISGGPAGTVVATYTKL